ncbi:MAG: homoaconitate hydratase family protein [Planctomycetota bacterium]|nr:MAG: homoaconitate hydratase family protein [Planctomycetota bacterium]
MRGETFVQKVLGRRAGRPVTVGDIVTVEPDRVMSHDNTAFVVKRFRATGYRRVWDPARVVVVFDHCVPAAQEAHARNHAEARAFVAEQGIEHFFDAGVGVCHQVLMERGLALPGELVLGADSHSTLYGAAGALGIPINRTEMAGVWATGKIWLKIPPTRRILLEGRLAEGVFAKDLVLFLLARLRADGAAYQAIEFGGPGAERLTMSERMTLCNMAVELGAKAGVVPCDSVTEAYLADRASGPYAVMASDPDAEFVDTFAVDLSALEPQVACPHTVDNVAPLSAVAGRPVQHAYLGSCTNGRLEDLRAAAAVLSGRRVAPGVRLVVYPASAEVAAAAEAEGVAETLRAAGAEILTASCGPCFGAVGAVLQAGQACISSSNRNFRGRMGSREAEVYLASPAVVAASAVAGCIADPRRLS